MRLCMFHPIDHPMERGWAGRIDDDRVVHLAAQTLQSFFTGGGSAREHAEYPLAQVRLLAPVLHPPAVRVFEGPSSFAFANPAAIVGPGASVASPWAGSLSLVPRIAGVIGSDGALAGFTVFADWRDPRRAVPKDRDFAVGVGPVVVTADTLDPDGLHVTVRVAGAERLAGALAPFDWGAAVDLAAEGTSLKPGDLLAGPGLDRVDGIDPGRDVELDVAAIGKLAHRVVA